MVAISVALFRLHVANVAKTISPNPFSTQREKTN